MTAVAARRFAVAAGMLTVLLSSLASRAVQAQSTPVYRCGSVYTQFPCAPEARALTLDGPPDAAARQSGTRIATAEARWGNRMRAERLAADARVRPALAGALGPTAVPVAVPQPKRRVTRNLSTANPTDGPRADFIAGVPAPPTVHKAVK